MYEVMKHPGFHNGPPSWTMAGKGGPYKVPSGSFPAHVGRRYLDISK